MKIRYIRQADAKVEEGPMRKRLPRPARFETIDYPRVMCPDKGRHVFHDYRSQTFFHNGEDGWYHCCGLGRNATDKNEH